jgi:hypothetical protein
MKQGRKTKSPKLDAYVAVSLGRGAADDLRDLERHHFMWSAWKRRHWPTDVIRKGLRLYGFDASSRSFSVLLEISRGGAFTYGSRRQLVTEIRRLTGLLPELKDVYGLRAPIPKDGVFHGVALRWRVLKRVDVPLEGRFPRLGWLRLETEDKPLGDVDPTEAFAEGGRQLRRHMRTERNGMLRDRARTFWRSRLGRLHCVVCSFDFEKSYGDLGADFIEMHHDRPLSLAPRRRLVRLDELKPLCANCHRMIHREQPMLELADLKARLKRRRRI